MNKKIMILGRSGSGKDTVAQALTKLYGLKQLCSSTTRPRRYEGEDTHIFVSEEEANMMTDRVAETVINGYQYFATRQQLDECDTYVIDPIGLKCMQDNAKNVPLCVVYVNASSAVRKDRAMKRASDPVEAETIFYKRQADEDGQFKEFENQIYRLGFDELKELFPTTDLFITIENNGSDKLAADRFAKKIMECLDENGIKHW